MDKALGKRGPKLDDRTLKLASILRAFPIPPSWDADAAGKLDNPMYANDRYGCCVISGRAHQTRRFERLEHHGQYIPQISDREVLDQYFLESGGYDAGLYVLDSLCHWRRHGWIAGGRREHIMAFASVDWDSKVLVKAACVSKCGLGVGLGLPRTAERQFDAGKPWIIAARTGDGEPYSWGGHYVYIVAYSALYLTCVTWGRRQKMSWPFFQRYCDEAYGIVDRPDGTKIDIPALDAYLEQRSPVVA